MSRWAVSCDWFISFAHFDEVSLPWNPSSRRLSTRRCRSFTGVSPTVSQNRALASTLPRSISARAILIYANHAEKTGTDLRGICEELIRVYLSESSIRFYVPCRNRRGLRLD